MISVTIIGPGRVGGALAVSLPKEKYVIEGLIGGTHIDTDFPILAPFTPFKLLDEVSHIGSDVIVITTLDGAIQQVADKIARKLRTNAFVFHTSGALTSSILDTLQQEGCHTGSIHPLVSISLPDLGPSRFPGSFFCVEGDPKAVEMGQQIASDLGGRPFEIATRFKTLYHAAAVMACGHLVALFDSSVEVMTKCGLPSAKAKEILLPLVTSTVENLAQQSTSSALTGTFGRADIETFTRHLNTLNENVSDDLLEIYLLLGERSLELASKQGVSPDRIDKLRAKMSVAKSRLKW